jgi:hypothetical protein
MEVKPRVPPFRKLDELIKLMDEKSVLDDKAAAKAKKREENGN